MSDAPIQREASVMQSTRRVCCRPLGGRPLAVSPSRSLQCSLSARERAVCSSSSATEQTMVTSADNTSGKVP